MERYRKEFNSDIEIIAGDTDSLFLRCQCVNRQALLDKMQSDELLDTSNYQIIQNFRENWIAKLDFLKMKAKGNDIKSGCSYGPSVIVF